ncbi:MAG: nucleotidyltransferase domain-containing protein [Prevotella sp.]
MKKNDYMNNESVISQMKSVATALIPKGGSAILYGSRARGDAKTNSDWDILILLDKDKLVQEDYEYAYPFRVLGWDMDEEINPQVYSKKEWEDYSYTPFHENVEQDKKVLVRGNISDAYLLLLSNDGRAGQQRPCSAY